MHGTCIRKSLNKQKKEEDDEIMDFSKRTNFFPLFIVSLISCLIYIVYIMKINNIQIGVTRDITTNSFATLLLLMSNSSLIIWMYELAYALLNEKKIKIYGVLSAVIYNLPGILISGRDALMIFLVATVIILIYCGNFSKKKLCTKGKMYKKIKKYAICIFVLIMIYLVLLSNNRYGSNQDSAINMFIWSSSCVFPEYLENIYYNCGGIGKVIINIMFYYSSQISKFALIFEEYEGPYMCGLYQLHYISRMFPESWNMNFGYVSQELAKITTNVGVPGIKVLWETGIGYSIYDFGRIGTLIMSMIFGIVVENVNLKCNRKKTIFKIILQTLICVAVFLTIAVSPLFDYFYIFPMIWFVIINLIYNKKGEKDEIK